MSKRKTVIELQSKPENKSVRRIIEKTKPVEFAPISPIVTKTEQEKSALGTNEKPSAKKTSNGEQTKTFKPQNQAEKEKVTSRKSVVNKKPAKKEAQNINLESSRTGIGIKAQVERLRIFQASTPVTRTTTKFQKAAIVVRGENGKQLIELSWCDQMNEKPKTFGIIFAFNSCRLPKIKKRTKFPFANGIFLQVQESNPTARLSVRFIPWKIWD
ncbi:MAG: hypothetical protein HC846_01120 [Blastocatellia bacterium]|nr:hypothetical protein [Blastocatellia bacterium]